MEREEFSFGNRGMNSSNNGHEMAAAEKGGNNGVSKTMPPASVMTRLILIMVWRKLIRNPNTYSSLIGLTWSLVSFRYFFSLKTSKLWAWFMFFLLSLLGGMLRCLPL